VELRYRQRYVDLFANLDAREVFVKRAKVLKALRTFFDSRGYLEVETPMMQPIAGGLRRGRSRRITMRWTWICICGSRPSCI